MLALRRGHVCSRSQGEALTRRPLVARPPSEMLSGLAPELEEEEVAGEAEVLQVCPNRRWPQSPLTRSEFEPIFFDISDDRRLFNHAVDCVPQMFEAPVKRSAAGQGAQGSAIAGCRVSTGQITKEGKFRVVRDGKVLNEELLVRQSRKLTPLVLIEYSLLSAPVACVSVGSLIRTLTHFQKGPRELIEPALIRRA